MPNETFHEWGLMRCSTCRGFLGPSGREPQRFVCEVCGQHYYLVMQLVPVESLNRPELQESTDAGGST